MGVELLVIGYWGRDEVKSVVKGHWGRHEEAAFLSAFLKLPT
jgi:hypothetical protein